MCAYHIPALLAESIMGLKIKPNGNYVDVTYGGGGHSKEILKHLKKGQLFAFDQDEDAINNKIDDDRLTFVHGNFRFIKNFLRFYDIGQVDGIIADLGISFHQVDELSRGFSFKSDATIDMRMNKNSDFTASDVLNGYEAEKLAFVFKEYGELNNGWKIAQTIVEARFKKKLTNIGQLIGILEKFAPKKLENKFYAKVFQALRIEVNREMEALKEFLEQTPSVLKQGGRLVVISYHSLEDRMVKNFIRSGNFDGTVEKDVYGNFHTPFSIITKKIIVPSDAEVTSNPRSRSAKLRIAEKN
jgi:16S rRNA (cytosine1402-N4)-methyltransferase